MLPQWMVLSSVERGSSYVDADFGNASDLIANPTLDFLGKPVALSDRHVGIDGTAARDSVVSFWVALPNVCSGKRRVRC